MPTVRLITVTLAVGAVTGVLGGCSMLFATTRGPVASPPDTVGPNPTLGPVESTLIPTVQYAPAGGWPTGTRPTAAAGLAVNAFATGLDHPRWLYVLPNGDVLVAETNSPPKPDDAKGIKGAVQTAIQRDAGAEVPTANRITLLRDTTGSGVADVRTTFLSHLNSPFGMALVGDTLYVADTDAIRAYPYRTGDTRIAAEGRTVTDLPAGTINHHWTKNIIASGDGRSLYATTGSNSNVGENGAQAEVGRAAIYQVDLATGAKHLYATGLRNPNGMAWVDGTLWTVANERDELGNDLVPDYLTSVKAGAFYGWPYSYFGQHVDDPAAAAAPRPGGHGDRARLRAGRARRAPRPGRRRLDGVAGAVRGRRLHRRARLLEPQAAGRLQGRLRALPQRQAFGPACRRAERLRQRRRDRTRAPGRSRAQRQG